MEDKMEKDKPSSISRQDVARSKEGPTYGEQLTGPNFKKLTRKEFLRFVPRALAALLLVAQIREAAKVDIPSASGLGPTPRVLPTPEGIEQFEERIEKVQKPDEAIPAATETQQEEIKKRQKLEILRDLNLEEYSNRILLKTAMDSNRGIDFLNRIILDSLDDQELVLDGISEEEIIFVLAWDRPDIAWGQRIGDYMILNAIAYGEILWEEARDEKGKPKLSTEIIDPVHRVRLISVIIHEEIHQIHWRRGNFYSDTVLHEVQEDLTNYLVHLATRVFASDEEGWEWPTESGISPDAEKGTRLVNELDAVNGNGFKTVLKAAITGDIVSLERYYDSFYGEGSFREVDWISRYNR